MPGEKRGFCMPIKRQIKAWKRNLFMLLLLVVGASVAMPVYYIFSRTQTIITEETQSKAINLAAAMSAFLSYNIESYRAVSDAEILVEGSDLERSYLAFNEVFRQVKKQSDATFIYTSKYLDDQTSVFVLDGESPASVLFSPFGSRDSMDALELETLVLGVPTVTGLADDSVWGTYLSAYAPIIDSRDKTVVGLVGVDYSEDHMLVRYRRVGWILISSFAFFTLLITLALHVLIITIQNRSGIDELTRLGTKRAMMKSLRMVFSEARKNNHNFVLCMLDVNSFKAINDTYGHPVGDSVLRCIGRALIQATDTTKGCFRYGGDEFTVILPNTTLLQAQAVKKSMEDEIGAITIPELKGMKVSASIGMAEWLPGITVETLIDLADKDLYVQKQKQKKAAL